MLKEIKRNSLHIVISFQFLRKALIYIYLLLFIYYSFIYSPLFVFVRVPTPCGVLAVSNRLKGLVIVCVCLTTYLICSILQSEFI